MSRMHYEFEMSLKSSDEDIEEWAQAVAGDDACGYEVIRRHGHWATLKAEADYGKTNEALNVYPIYSVSDKGKKSAFLEKATAALEEVSKKKGLQRLQEKRCKKFVDVGAP